MRNTKYIFKTSDVCIKSCLIFFYMYVLFRHSLKADTLLKYRQKLEHVFSLYFLKSRTCCFYYDYYYYNSFDIVSENISKMSTDLIKLFQAHKTQPNMFDLGRFTYKYVQVCVTLKWF